MRAFLDDKEGNIRWGLLRAREACEQALADIGGDLRSDLIRGLTMNLEQAARYARISEIVLALEEPGGLFSLAEAISLVETAWQEQQDHFVRVAFIELVLGLTRRRLFPDVARALTSLMLEFDRDQNTLRAAAEVAAAHGDEGEAASLLKEATHAPDHLLPVEDRP